MVYPSGRLYGFIDNPRLKPKERPCLKCDELFMSEGFHNAKCDKCRGKLTYKNDVELGGLEPAKLHVKIDEPSLTDMISLLSRR